MKMRFYRICLAVLFLSPMALLNGQVDPRSREPNTTIQETLIGYGRTKQRAEQAVLAEARQVAFDGEFELKSIGLGGRDDDFYCIIQIKHDIYRPEDRRTMSEVTVGYGETMQESEANARVKAEAMIADRLRSAEERRKRQKELDRIRGNRDSATYDPDSSTVIVDKENDTSYILQSIRFSGRPEDYQCYIKFEYLVAK